MGWTTPRDWTTGEIVTEAMLDTHIKDNLRYLKGLDGAITLGDALILPDGAGYYLHIPILTTVQRDALTPTAGMMVYNSTTTQFNKYENGAWRADLGFNSAHSGLSGLTSGDDHTQYLKESLLTAQGDIPYATGASTWDRLPKGTASQVLRVNAGATAPEWSTPVLAIATGSYTGTDAQNRAIAHGLGATPKLVFITRSTTDQMYRIHGDLGWTALFGQGDTGYAVTIPDATNFYVGSAAGGSPSSNWSSGGTYYWVAIL